MSLRCLLDLRNDICDTCLSIRSILSRNSMKVIFKFNTFRDILVIFTHPYISRKLFLKKKKIGFAYFMFFAKTSYFEGKKFYGKRFFTK